MKGRHKYTGSCNLVTLRLGNSLACHATTESGQTHCHTGFCYSITLAYQREIHSRYWWNLTSIERPIRPPTCFVFMPLKRLLHVERRQSKKSVGSACACCLPVPNRGVGFDCKVYSLSCTIGIFHQVILGLRMERLIWFQLQCENLAERS